MNKQEVFNACYLGVIKQGGAAARPNGDCFYRIEGSERMCAAGHLMAKIGLSEHSPAWGDTASWTVVGPCYIEDNYPDLAPHRTFIRRIQGIHDTSAHDAFDDNDFLSNFMQGMEYLAEQEGLEIPQVA